MIKNMEIEDWGIWFILSKLFLEKIENLTVRFILNKLIWKKIGKFNRRVYFEQTFLEKI